MNNHPFATQPADRSQIDNNTMTIEQIKREIATCYLSGVMDPVALWGQVGIGKTLSFHQLVRYLDRKLRELFKLTDQDKPFGLKVIHPAQHTPTDIRGVPVADREEKVTRFLITEMLPHEHIDGKYGFLFIDEINQANKTMLDLMQQLILSGQIGGYQLPAGWMIVVAGNRKEDMTGVQTLPAAVANRLVHYNVIFSPAEVVNFMIEHDYHPDIIAFMQNPTNHQYIHKMNRDNFSGPWASPRTWRMADRRYKVGLGIAGCVGPEAATAFKTYLSLRDLMPDLNDILLNGARSAEKLKAGDVGLMYMTLVNLIFLTQNAEAANQVHQWFVRESHSTRAEWNSLFWNLMSKHAQRKHFYDALVQLLDEDALADMASESMEFLV